MAQRLRKNSRATLFRYRPSPYVSWYHSDIARHPVRSSLLRLDVCFLPNLGQCVAGLLLKLSLYRASCYKGRVAATLFYMCNAQAFLLVKTGFFFLYNPKLPQVAWDYLKITSKLPENCLRLPEKDPPRWVIATQRPLSICTPKLLCVAQQWAISEPHAPQGRLPEDFWEVREVLKRTSQNRDQKTWQPEVSCRLQVATVPA